MIYAWVMKNLLQSDIHILCTVLQEILLFPMCSHRTRMVYFFIACLAIFFFSAMAVCTSTMRSLSSS